MNPRIKYLIGLAIAGIVLYHSVYFQPLDVALAEDQETVFDAQALVEGLWDSRLPEAYDSAMDLEVLLVQLKEEPESVFEQQARALGIGNIGYFKVKGEGEVQAIKENHVLIRMGEQLVEIETEFVFGNAVRDASGLIRLQDYDNTSDFNAISAAINEKIRKVVIPPFQAEVQEGHRLRFYGALELNQAHLDLRQPEVIPLSLQLLP